jgi:hypothetical protein
MSQAQSATDQINKVYAALLPDLQPATVLERMFAMRIARFSALSEFAQTHMLTLDPAHPEQRRDYHKFARLMSSYDRELRLAYNELRRLQTERAAASESAVLAEAPRLARTAVLTKPDGSLKPKPKPATPAQAAQPEPPQPEERSTAA